MNRKALFLLSLLMMFINSAVFGTEFQVPEENPAVKDFVTEFSEAIVDHCHFDRSKPVEVIMDSQTLSDQLNRYDREQHFYQYLLIYDDYEFNTPVKVKQNARLCGVHDWFSDLNFQLVKSMHDWGNVTEATDQVINQTMVETGRGSFNNCNSTSMIQNIASDLLAQCQSYQRAEKTTLFFVDSGENKALLSTIFAIELYHLKLSVKGSRKTRRPLLEVAASVRGTTMLSDVELEDLNGVANSLLKVGERDQMYADNTTFNFRQRPDGSSKAIHLFWTGFIRFDSCTINCRGTQGTVIYWDGVLPTPHQPKYLRNMQVNVERGANMTGMYLLGTQKDFYFIRVEFSNITLTGGIRTGFEFVDDFRLAATDDCGIASTNNHWHSDYPNAQRCVGNPSWGILLFADDFACVPKE